MSFIEWFLLAPMILLSWAVCGVAIYLVHLFLKTMRNAGK